MYNQKKLKSRAEYSENKPLHGYVHKKVSENNNIDQILSREWITNKFMTSHFEAYACAITKQEIGSKDVILQQEKLHQQPSTTDNKCLLCKKEVEDVTHILNSCSKMSSRHYLLQKILKISLSKKKVKWNSGEMYQSLHLPRSSTINLFF